MNLKSRVFRELKCIEVVFSFFEFFISADSVIQLLADTNKASFAYEMFIEANNEGGGCANIGKSANTDSSYRGE